MRRGEICWADLPGPAGRRQAVLISLDEAYIYRTLSTIPPVSIREEVPQLV